MMCVEWDGLGLILKPICDALKMNLNRSNIVCHLGAAARKIRQELTTILKGKLLCLKIDCATRLGRHILGINIQYYCELQKDVVIYTIGNNPHSQVNLFKNTHAICSEFHVLPIVKVLMKYE